MTPTIARAVDSAMEIMTIPATVPVTPTTAVTSSLVYGERCRPMLPRVGAEPSSDSSTWVAAVRNGLMNSAFMGLASRSQELLQGAQHTVGLERLEYEIL